MKRILIAGAATAAVFVFVLFVHLPRSGTARVVRTGGSLRVLPGPVGFASRFAPACIAPFAAGRLRFDHSVVVTDSEERQFPAQIRFDYKPPRVLPPAWPEGDWCASLKQRVFEIAQQWTAAAPRDLILTDRREAGRTAASSMQKQLESGGLTIGNLTVRFTVPEELNAVLAVPEIVEKAKPARPVIFIGLDGADWTLLDPYIRTGLMPNLAALVREGRSGILKTQHPPLSPLLWNTMMTGVGPLEHRILGLSRVGGPQPKHLHWSRFHRATFRLSERSIQKAELSES